MNRRLMMVLSYSVWIASAAALSGCAAPKEMGSGEQPLPSEVIPLPPESYLPQDRCAEPVDMAWNMEAAGQAPALGEIAPPTPPALGLVGAQGASELAAGLAAKDTFCGLAVSDEAVLVIARAMRLVEQGKPDQARAVLAEWLGGMGSSRAGRLAAPARQTGSGRQAIRDLLNAAAADQAAGGDGSAFSSQANQAFRDLFAGEIGEAGFDDSMRLTEEALRLGETELAETAKNRARRIWEEKLRAALEDFDPCSATKEDVRDLLNSLAQAMLLGVPGSYEGEGQYYETVKAKAQAAAQQLFNQAAMKIGLPELTQPVPECTLGGHIEVRQMLAFAKEPCLHAIPFTLNWSGSQAQLEGSAPTECTHVEENLGGSPVAIHQVTHINMAFSGTASSGAPGSLQVTLTTSGEIIEFYSNFPEDSPQVFTEESPFQVPADGSFPLTFEFREGARAELTNQETGEAGFVFILHLDSGR